MAKCAIPLQPCQSSRIKEHGYDPATQTLALRFKSGAGAVYTYANVPPELYERLTKAPSIGQFFGQHIQSKAEHPFTKLVETDEEETA